VGLGMTNPATNQAQAGTGAGGSGAAGGGDAAKGKSGGAGSVSLHLGGSEAGFWWWRTRGGAGEDSADNGRFGYGCGRVWS